MTGTWLNYYKYDKELLQKAIGFDKTNFTITILSFDENNFKGIVTDDIESGGMEGTGEIIGIVEGENISFEKLMPMRTLLYQNGKRKSLDKKHPTLYYTGVFSKDKKEITGRWKFKNKFVFLFGFIPTPFKSAKEIWSMRLQ